MTGPAGWEWAAGADGEAAGAGRRRRDGGTGPTEDYGRGR